METKWDRVQKIMELTGWGGQSLPSSPKWNEPSTGNAAADLQAAFNWHNACHGNLAHWSEVFRSLMEWELNKIVLRTKKNTPSSYNAMCLFRVIGRYGVDDDDAATLFPEGGSKHYVGVCRGGEWLWKDAEGKLNSFDKRPVVDAWHYLD